MGPFCDVPVEHTCVNQCNGRGECYFGFCRCLDGWYGHDCAQRRKGHPMTPGEDLLTPQSQLPETTYLMYIGLCRIEGVQ